MTGIEQITLERKEHFSKHGKDVEMDNFYNSEEQLRHAASFLISYEKVYPGNLLENLPKGWNEDKWLYMCCKSYKERLVIAASLIAAEIDRLEYLKE